MIKKLLLILLFVGVASPSFAGGGSWPNYPQFSIYAPTANYTVNTVSAACAANSLCDLGRLVVANGTGLITFIVPNPSGVVGSYQFGDAAGFGYTVGTVGGTATFSGCVSGSPTSFTVAGNYRTQIYDLGTSYYCQTWQQTASQSLTGKTLDCSVNTCLNIPVTSAALDTLFGSSQGNMIYRSNTGWIALPLPTMAGTYQLQANGPGTSPQWVLVGASGCTTGATDLSTGCASIPLFWH